MPAGDCTWPGGARMDGREDAVIRFDEFTLDVSFTRITAVGANTLQRRVPGCSVLWAPRLAPGPQENSVR